MRLYDHRLECFLGQSHVLSLRRGRSWGGGRHAHVIDYRYVIHSLRGSVALRDDRRDGTEVGLDQAARRKRLGMKARCSGMSLAGAAAT
jgi:hypothetical protein